MERSITGVGLHREPTEQRLRTTHGKDHTSTMARACALTMGSGPGQMTGAARTEAAPRGKKPGRLCTLWYSMSSGISRGAAKCRLRAGVNRTAPTRTVVLEENAGSLPAHLYENDIMDFSGSEIEVRHLQMNGTIDREGWPPSRVNGAEAVDDTRRGSPAHRGDSVHTNDGSNVPGEKREYYLCKIAK